MLHPPVQNTKTTIIKETGLKGAGVDAEYEVILEVLKRVNFNKSKAAKLLKIDRTTLYKKIRQYKELNNIVFHEEV